MLTRCGEVVDNTVSESAFDFKLFYTLRVLIQDHKLVTKKNPEYPELIVLYILSDDILYNVI